MPRTNGATERTSPTRAGTSEIILAMAKPDLGKRFFALLIDVVLAVVVGFIPLIGGLIGAAYWLVRDGLEFDFMDRRSIGKKVMKLRPMRLDGRPMDIATSVQRNWMFALGGIVSLLLFVPIIGWLLMVPVALVGVGMGLFEIYKVLTDDKGRRLGDSIAKTRVVEVAD
jgi:uncharacterized RDD family membrane protein YckC